MAVDVNNMPRYHVYPLDDLREHETEDHTSCWCHPTLNEEGVVVHHSMDGREAYEGTGRKMH
jgi:hypothetical protein